jgi:VIT1/CCC1 family predicted Fe2+/Mn2+ transporter
MAKDEQEQTTDVPQSVTQASLTVGESRGTLGTSVPASGRRQAFRDVRRELTDADLASVGVQKMVLDELEQAEAECEQLRAYIERYHEADKRAAILEEKLRPLRAVEIFFGIGVGLGGAIIGLTPFFWDSRLQGLLCLLIGILMIFGSTIGRMVKG